MTAETFFQIAQLSTILLGFLGVGVSLRNHRRQMHAQMFIEFSSRFHNVLRALPPQIWTAHEFEGEPLPPRSEALTRACMQCFHVIAEIHQLHRCGYVAPDLWRPCQRGIRRAMQAPLLRREWQAVEPAFEHNPELCRYMRGITAGDGAASGRRRPRFGQVLVDARHE